MSIQKEFKLFYINKDGDPFVLLLHTFIILLNDENYFNNDYLLGKEGGKGYIDNCFFCGCLPDIAGKEISYFLLQGTNLYNLYNKIKKLYRGKSESYYRGVIEGLFKKLLTTLRKDKNKQYERIMLFNENEQSTIILNKDNICDLKKFYNKNFNHKNTDFAAIYSALKKDYPNGITIYLSLNNDSKPRLPLNIASDFVFCTKTNRSALESCRTKTYIKNHIITKNRKYKPLYNFVGLPFSFGLKK